MTIPEIKKLVEQFPNDMELGQAVRAVYWKARNGETKDPTQLNLFEDDDEKRDDAVLGYD